MTISGIISRNDDWDNKASKVNDQPKEMCRNTDSDFLDYRHHLNAKKHLSNSKLHLNEKESSKAARF